MAWFGKRPRTRKRLELERKALAASVEEITAQNGPGSDLWNGDESESAESGAALVPPLLHLQSRPLPAVRLGVMDPAPETHAQTLAGSGFDALPLVDVQKKRLGRSTKVHLQAVRPGEQHESFTDHVPAVTDKQEEFVEKESITDGMQSLVISQVERVEEDHTASAYSHLPGGSALIEQGQEEVMVSHSQISERSLVTVMLTGDPGPVVVHYISLQPAVGFTVHLSAPVAAPTPFNYIVWDF